MKRRRLPRGKDRRVFRNTVDKTKSINVYKPTLMRGGFRL